ncbi:hypothetical protein SAMN05216226_102136 [Halovenus aranensis]|uniref:Uncharacterized protein n=1 Tax=Halovenus aranensis TaxID=890420 RepID=A0A1G8STH6_9EURY|nr:hypothetical protein [Halovenus aranensis]SDJ32463.1 hypothetical protein SAMN05216226_102136 [Halovenus aranensis]
MPANEVHEVDLYGNSLTIELREMRSGGKREIDIESDDGRKWRVVATSTGSLDHIETTWRDGKLADLDEPDWMGDLFAQLSGA